MVCDGTACYGVPMVALKPRSMIRGMKPVKLRVVAEAAAALGRVANVYRLEDGDMLCIPKEELQGAEYLDGGNILRTSAGTLYHPLAMRRAEAIGAIQVLSSSQ